MQLITESLFCSTQIRIAARFCVLGKNGCACKSEDVVVLEELRNLDVHIPELAAVALIEDKNKVLAQNGVLRILGDEIVELLNGGNYDFVLVRIAFCIFILKLSLQNLCVLVSVGCSSLKAVILFHGLIVKVFSIDYEQHLVDVRQF